MTPSQSQAKDGRFQFEPDHRPGMELLEVHESLHHDVSIIFDVGCVQLKRAAVDVACAMMCRECLVIELGNGWRRPVNFGVAQSCWSLTVTYIVVSYTVRDKTA